MKKVYKVFILLRFLGLAGKNTILGVGVNGYGRVFGDGIDHTDDGEKFHAVVCGVQKTF